MDVETAVSALFAIGVGLGSVLAAVVAEGCIRLLPVPLSGLVMAAFLLDLGVATLGLPKAAGEVTLGAFFASASGLRIAIDVAGLAAAGGMFVVPIFSAVQAWAGEDRRARVIAAINIMNAIFMVGGAIIVAALQVAGASEPAR